METAGDKAEARTAEERGWGVTTVRSGNPAELGRD